MKFILYIIFLIIPIYVIGQNVPRIDILKIRLDSLATSLPGLNNAIDSKITLNEIELGNYITAISNINQINLVVSPELNNYVIRNNFSNINLSQLLLYLCNEYDLTIDILENILTIRPLEENELLQQYKPVVNYYPTIQNIDIDIKNNELYTIFKLITNKTAKNLLFAPGMENLKLTAYIKNTPFDAAMEKLAYANQLNLTVTDDDFYVFEEIKNKVSVSGSGYGSALKKSINFKVLDSTKRLLMVDFKETSIKSIINEISHVLKLNFFIASPLDQAGNITFKTDKIYFDDLLVKIFETRESSNIDKLPNQSNTSSNSASNTSQKSVYTFKKEGDVYYYGTADQLSVRQVELIMLNYRSVNLMSDPELLTETNNIRDNFNTAGQNFRNQLPTGFNNPNVRPQELNNNNLTNHHNNENQRTILDIIPTEVKSNLDFTVDPERNSIYVTGSSAKITAFKSFIKNIDKSIPVIIIEVMIVEAQTSNTLETGVSWGIGNEPVTTQGNLFPTTDLTLGAETINRIISGFSSTSVFNFGKVIPNFYATIKAMETNGDLKIKSTPKLATLNGHKASFSNGQTSYYAIVQRNIIGTDNPQTSEIRNYFPVDAKLGLDIMPYVTGNNQVLLEINVIQSSFGQRIAEDAPPDINSRNFSSIVRMQDQDIAVLGGLEENFTNNSGSGVPFLARIPLIKFLFSQRVREGRKSKLTVFIKPTIIY
ncbi:general secretion pathway protein GspD [Paucihalobacter ruber]|uniref:General secretion pathway protein GspD n=1 Tax=Paucihalobacter ruber TaxID=2567861 RepID=A0A506PPH8_9FLAO|nr:general secretion pathway protein GspD [Paucihalobacter ruber]TPV35102.1 general secretion pathway protein GspD [Paucihalobacter ruber]